MRVSPVALLYRGRSLADALAASDRVTEITHDHPENIKGARAVTEANRLAQRGEGSESVRGKITTRYGYDLNRSVEAIRPSHRFDVISLPANYSDRNSTFSKKALAPPDVPLVFI